MSRRADAPQTTNADSPRAAQLKRAARTCASTCRAADHLPDAMEHCPLAVAIPSGTVPGPDTIDAVEAITGHRYALAPVRFTTPAWLRSQVRRWVAITGTGTAPLG